MTYDPMPDIYAAVGWPVDTAPVVHTVNIFTAVGATFANCSCGNWLHESMGTNDDVFRYVVARGKKHSEGLIK